MEEVRKTRGRRVKYVKDDDYVNDDSDMSDEANGVGDERDEDLRKSRIRDTNKEFAKRMAILSTWSDYWMHYTTRDGEAYSKADAKNILKKAKKISCPIESCRKAYTTLGGLRYHYARCNIERCFKCKVCSPYSELKTRGDLLRHMIRVHYERLPPLKNEQEEIALGFLSTDSRSERAKFKRSIFADTEHGQAQPRFYVKSFSDLVTNAFDHSRLKQRPFKGWYASRRDWEYIFSDIERRRFYPPEQTSARFKSSSQSTYMALDIGESVAFKAENERNNTMIFYTGGVNTSAAWLPKPCNTRPESNIELVAIAVNSCSMDRSITYKDMKDINGCIQFWTTTLSSGGNRSIIEEVQQPRLEFMIGHNFGLISSLVWCPLGTSWDPPDEPTPDGKLARMGLLALACGDALVRIISIPHLDYLRKLTLSLPKRFDDSSHATPMFRVKQVATLMRPGVGISTDCQPIACTSLCWNVDDNQRLIVAGYSNGDVALFDLANSSPILYSSVEDRHIYQSYKKWQAHLLPVLGVGILSNDIERTYIASGGRDRQLRLWKSNDIGSGLSFERAPITNLVWDFRLRGVVTASEAAFTSFINRVSYRYPALDGFAGVTVSVHRATVCGLGSNLVTSSLATSDEAGEVFVLPTGRPSQKRTKNIMDTLSLYTLVPHPRVSLGGPPRDIKLPALNTDITARSLHVENEMIEQTNDDGDPKNEDIDESNMDQITDDYTFAERSIANMPAKILLPIDERAVDTYADFKNNFVLEFIEYDDKLLRSGSKLPEAWTRAKNSANIYCDRVCDYPFSSIKHVSWSPNVNSYSHLLSSTHVGFCRIDRVSVLETIYKGHIDALLGSHSKEKISRP